MMHPKGIPATPSYASVWGPPQRTSPTQLSVPHHPSPGVAAETRNPQTGRRELVSVWQRQNKRAVNVGDLARDPETVAMLADVKDNIAAAIINGENAMRPIDTRQEVGTVAPQSGEGRALAAERAIAPTVHQAMLQAQHDGTYNAARFQPGGKRAGFDYTEGSYTLPDPNIIPHWYGEHSQNVQSSYRMRPAHLKPNFTEHVVANSLTGRECQDSLAEKTKRGGSIDKALMEMKPRFIRPMQSRMVSRMQRGGNNLVPQTSAQDNHAASAVRQRVDTYNRPAGLQNVWPTGVSPAGIPSPADPTRANLRRLPNAVHTTPIAAMRDAHAAGVGPLAAARGDGRNEQGQPLTPYTDNHGFTFGYRHRTDFRTPNFYPARDLGSDKLFYENAARYQPDYHADLMDRVAAAMVDRFPEPLESREALQREYMKDFTCTRDRYTVARTGRSVVNPSRQAKHDNSVNFAN